LRIPFRIRAFDVHYKQRRAESMKTCGKCMAYSRALGRCIGGKVNPRTKKATKTVMEFYGDNGYTICDDNKWKAKLLRGE